MNRNRESIHTKISYYAGILAFIGQFIIGIPHLFDSNINDQIFGRLCLLEGSMALIGIFFIDLVRGNGIQLKPDNFRKNNPLTFMRFVIIFVIMIGIQFITQFIPLTIRSYERALAIIFCGVSEELFFRGFLISLFIRMGKNSNVKFRITKKKEISIIEIMGILVSAVLFALIHANYYNNLAMLISVFVAGLGAGICFWIWEDLTACILAHLLLNIVAVGQSFYMVYL